MLSFWYFLTIAKCNNDLCCGSNGNNFLLYILSSVVRNSSPEGLVEILCMSINSNLLVSNTKFDFLKKGSIQVFFILKSATWLMYLMSFLHIWSLTAPKSDTVIGSTEQGWGFKASQSSNNLICFLITYFVWFICDWSPASRSWGEMLIKSNRRALMLDFIDSSSVIADKRQTSALSENFLFFILNNRIPLVIIMEYVYQVV